MLELYLKISIAVHSVCIASWTLLPVTNTSLAIFSMVVQSSVIAATAFMIAAKPDIERTKKILVASCVMSTVALLGHFMSVVQEFDNPVFWFSTLASLSSLGVTASILGYVSIHQFPRPEPEPIEVVM